MKKVIISIISIFLMLNSYGETINLPYAGSLTNYVDVFSDDTLKITGQMNAKDFKQISYNFSTVTTLDLRDVEIVAYSGTEGTDYKYENGYQVSLNYAASELPYNAIPYRIINLILPNNLQSINNMAFSSSRNLQSIMISNENADFSTIDNYLYDKAGTTLIKCCSLTGATYSIPDNILEIKNYAFYDSEITQIKVNSKLETISPYAFSRLNNLEKIDVDEQNLTFSSLEGALASKDSTILYIVPLVARSIGQYSVPASVTSLGDGVFDGLSSMQIYIHDKVTSFGKDIFTNVFESEIHINSITPPSLETQSFQDDMMMFTLWVPTDAISEYQNATNWGTLPLRGKTEVIIHNDIEGGLGANILENYSSLTSITHLTVSGAINLNDILLMKSNMSSLVYLNIEDCALANNTLPNNSFAEKDGVYWSQFKLKLCTLVHFALASKNIILAVWNHNAAMVIQFLN